MQDFLDELLLIKFQAMTHPEVCNIRCAIMIGSLNLLPIQTGPPSCVKKAMKVVGWVPFR